MCVQAFDEKGRIVRRAKWKGSKILGLGAAVTTLAAAVCGSGVAVAQTGNYVSLGDSLAANPNNLQLAASKNPVIQEQFNIETAPAGRCVNGEDNFPKRLAAQTGLTLENYACAGGTVAVGSVVGTSLSDQVNTALAEGTLNAGTQLITMTFGFNDWYQDPITDKPTEQRKAEATQALTEQVARIRAAAPNARIIFLGYPDLTDGQNNICPTNAFGVQTHVYNPFFTYLQDNIRDWQVEATSLLGIEFIDMSQEINVANDNNGCTANPDRLSAALIDDAQHNLWGHLTAAGNQYYADRVQSLL